MARYDSKVSLPNIAVMNAPSIRALNSTGNGGWISFSIAIHAWMLAFHQALFAISPSNYYAFLKIPIIHTLVMAASGLYR